VTEPAKPRPLAVIREAECIGCTKCIQVCPVDAILGSAKKMHTVIADECIGCKLCLPPCPVDCIDLILPLENLESPDPESRKQKAAYIKKRVTARQKRLQKQEEDFSPLSNPTETLDKSKTYIQNALLRLKLKK
jgi:electron transport complex protein RnfB